MRFSEYKRNYYKVNILTDLKDCYIALSKGHTPEEIVDFMGASLEDVLSVQEKMLQGEQGDNL